MDRLTAARVFVEVADRGSLTQAADRLEMSAAMVSRYLATAEAWLGARLLHRTTRRVSLTDAGQAALPRCRQMLDLADELQLQTGGQHHKPEGRLRVTTSASFAHAQLTAAILAFQQQYPKVHVELLVGDRAVDLVEDRIDLALRITNTLDPFLVSRRLAVCRSVLCAAPSYLASHGTPATPDDLAQAPCISRPFGDGTRWRLSHAGQPCSVDVSGPLLCHETLLVWRAVLDGAGIGMLPTYLVAPDLQSGQLVRVLPDYEPDTLDIHAVYLSRRHQPLVRRLFIDFLAQRFDGEQPPWDRG